MGAQFRKADYAGFPDQGYVDVEPARIVPGSFGVEVFALAIELGFIGIGQFRDLGDSGDSRLRTTRVVEENAIADHHLITHEIARLIVAHTPPRRGLARRSRQIIDAEHPGFGLHQPVIHGYAAEKKEFRISGTLSDRKTLATRAAISRLAARDFEYGAPHDFRQTGILNLGFKVVAFRAHQALPAGDAHNSATLGSN